MDCIFLDKHTCFDGSVNVERAFWCRWGPSGARAPDCSPDRLTELEILAAGRRQAGWLFRVGSGEDRLPVSRGRVLQIWTGQSTARDRLGCCVSAEWQLNLDTLIRFVL